MLGLAFHAHGQEGLLKPFARWKEFKFSREQLADGTSDDLVAPIGDGVTNLQKYAFGISPFQDGTGFLPVLGVVNDHLTLSYRVVPGAFDLSYIAEVTSHLAGPWASGANSVEFVGSVVNPDLTQTITVRDKTAMSTATSRFIRLRITRLTTDADNDGMNDDLELFYFGEIDETASGDFDGDGVSNLQEILNGTDPSDFYNGQQPILTIVSGDNQSAIRGAYLSSSLIVLVKTAGGVPLNNAPVTFTAINGGNLDNSAPRTDPSGQASTRFQMPDYIAGGNSVRVDAGKPPNQTSVTFTVQTIDPPTPPSNVTVVTNGDGSIDMTWENVAADATDFAIQLRNQFGEWETIGSVSAGSTSVHINPDRTIAP